MPRASQRSISSIRPFTDFFRRASSGAAKLYRYESWATIVLRPVRRFAAWKAAISSLPSGLLTHWREDLVKICTVSQPTSLPKRRALSTPPAIDMCAPNSGPFGADAFFAMRFLSVSGPERSRISLFGLPCRPASPRLYGGDQEPFRVRVQASFDREHFAGDLRFLQPADDLVRSVKAHLPELEGLLLRPVLIPGGQFLDFSQPEQPGGPFHVDADCDQILTVLFVRGEQHAGETDGEGGLRVRLIRTGRSRPENQQQRDHYDPFHVHPSSLCVAIVGCD